MSSEVDCIKAGAVKSAGGSRLDAALAAYQAAPLAVSADKVFRDADKASFWGITVRGRSIWIKAKPRQTLATRVGHFQDRAAGALRSPAA